MFRHISTLAAMALLVLATSATAADKVKLRQGPPVLGNLTQMSPDQVIIEQGPVKKTIPVNEFSSIEFEDEPDELMLVRSAYEDGRFAEAFGTVSKVDLEDVKRPEILQDIAFYKAASMARLALGGGGSAQEAGKLLVAFEKKDTGNYHYLEVCELLGDLLVSAGRVDNAQTYYDKLASSSFPEYKLKANVLGGRALQSQKQYDKAIAKFDEVISGAGDSKDAVAQALAATLGKAMCLAATGKAPEVLKLVEDVIAKADAGDLELHARAYNALGTCYVAAGKKKEALIAFLHTDLLFSGYPEQHAEVLANLGKLWTEVDKNDRAADAKRTLKERYPASKFAQGT